jgi:hypothetical protein
MSLIRIEHNPTRRQLNAFGLIWLVFFGVLGGVVASRGGSTVAAGGWWVAAVVVPAIGWLAPRFMRIVYLGMAYAAYPLGFAISHVLLAAVYYLVLTPTAMVMRVLGYDPMSRRFDPSAESYWVPREAEKDVTRYFRQS